MEDEPKIDFDQILEDPFYFRQLWDNPMVGLAVLDLNHRFQRVNTTYCRILGYENSDQIVGRTWMEFTTEDTSRADSALASATAIGDLRVYELDKKYKHPDGREVAVKIAVKLIYSKEGARLSFYTTCIEADLRERIYVPQPSVLVPSTVPVAVPPVDEQHEKFMRRIKRQDAVMGWLLKVFALLGLGGSLMTLFIRYVVMDMANN